MSEDRIAIKASKIDGKPCWILSEPAQMGEQRGTWHTLYPTTDELLAALPEKLANIQCLHLSTLTGKP